MLYRVHFAGSDLTTLVVIGTNCTGSWKHFRYCFLRMLFTFFFFISANVNIRLRGYWLNTHRVLYLWTLGSPYHNNDSYRIQIMIHTVYNSFLLLNLEKMTYIFPKMYPMLYCWPSRSCNLCLYNLNLHITIILHNKYCSISIAGWCENICSNRNVLFYVYLRIILSFVSVVLKEITM